MLVIAIAATVVAFIQNIVMLSLGMKEQAIFSFPLSFIGVFLTEIALIWIGYFAIRWFLPYKRALTLFAWAIVVLGAAELMLPASYFATLIQQAKRKHVLNQIEYSIGAIEALASSGDSKRFALTYDLRFPKTGHYLTFPAYIGSQNNRVFGNYFTKLHPEYYDENYLFDAGKPYRFTVVFDTEGKPLDFSKDKAKIDICDGKDYFMACRIIELELVDVPARFANHPSPGRSEPDAPAGNIRDITEKSIRLDGLTIKSATNKTGLPIDFSYVITNVGRREVAIPDGNFDSVIGINYAWEAISESAKQTKVIPGIARFGDAIAAGTAQFSSVHKSTLAPGDKVLLDDKISTFEPLAPGEYRLHLFLFSRYATELNKPEQELVQTFYIIP